MCSRPPRELRISALVDLRVWIDVLKYGASFGTLRSEIGHGREVHRIPPYTQKQHSEGPAVPKDVC